MDGRAHSRFARVEGVRLHWVEIDPRTGKTPLVLLHGLYDSHLTWQGVAPVLAQDRRVLMPDLPGHGRSERPNATYELDWHAQLMSAWFHAAGLATADVLGHSYGGGVAQQMLLLGSRERIRRLILVASGGLGRELGFALRLAALPLVVELLGQPFMSLGTRLALRGASYSAAELAELSEMNAQRGSARAFARTVRDIADWHGQRRAFMQRAHEVAELPPIALYWGDRDPLIPMAHAASFMSAVGPVAFRRFAGCGHYLHRQRPDEFVRAVREFLDARSQPAARLRPSAGAGEATKQGERWPIACEDPILMWRRDPVMRLSDETIRARTVIASDGVAIGSVGMIFIDSDGWRVESLQVQLHKDVADRLGANRSWLHAGAVEIPIRMVQSVGDAVVLSVPVDELRQVLPGISEAAPAS